MLRDGVLTMVDRANAEAFADFFRIAGGVSEHRSSTMIAGSVRCAAPQRTGIESVRCGSPAFRC
jgi:hypothetical protein